MPILCKPTRGHERSYIVNPAYRFRSYKFVAAEERVVRDKLHVTEYLVLRFEGAPAGCFEIEQDYFPARPNEQNIRDQVSFLGKRPWAAGRHRGQPTINSFFNIEPPSWRQCALGISIRSLQHRIVKASAGASPLAILDAIEELGTGDRARRRLPGDVIDDEKDRAGFFGRQHPAEGPVIGS